MAEIITMPRLSDTMTEGKVAKWHKNVGQEIKEGDILAEIETDKAVQDFESEVKGTLLYVGVQEGENAPIDSILAIIGDKNEDISSLIGGQKNISNKENPQTEIKHKEANESKNKSLPKGVEVITMPRLSDTMTEGKVAQWHKNIGDEVKEGDLLAEIETDKAVQEFESEHSGVLLYQGVEQDGVSAVDTILAIIGPKDTDISAVISNQNGIITSSADKKAEDTIQQNKVVDAPKQEIKTSTERISISPLAKKIAKEKGIDLSQIKGSGDNGRIVKKDVENFTPNLKTETQQINFAFPTTNETTETINSQMRNVIAKRLSESKFSAPHYYLMIEVDMDKAIAVRKEINNLPEVKISFNDMVIKATAMALKKHPQINSSWAGDKIIHHGAVHIGVAVAVPDGLVVPVVKNADMMTYGQISASVKDLASRAKNKSLKANEMEGSTFSISNLGMFGIETFTSIINQPNSAILSVGAIIEKPVVKNGNIVVGNTMKLSLACDHRVIDGATGAEFLQTIKSFLEQPYALLV